MSAATPNKRGRPLGRKRIRTETALLPVTRKAAIRHARATGVSLSRYIARAVIDRNVTEDAIVEIKETNPTV